MAGQAAKKQDDQGEVINQMADARKKALRALPSRRLEQKEAKVGEWFVVVNSGTAKEDIENPDFWQHHAKSLGRYDELTIRCEDGSYFATAIVRAIGPAAVKMHIREWVELDPMDPDALELPSGYNVAWAGEIEQWRVTKGPAIVKAGFPHKSGAYRWLNAHVASLTR